MRRSKATVVAALLGCLWMVACSDDAPSGPVGVNNGETTNNGSTDNNGQPNNGQTNNGQGCSCLDGQLCVTNATVSETCYDLDCVGMECGDGEVCDRGACVAEGCAGVDCAAGSCVDGQCVVEGCGQSPDPCADGSICQDGVCRAVCDDLAECPDGLACVDGGCRPCAADAECGQAGVCDEGVCIADCAQDASVCGVGDVCNPETRRCQATCASDAACAPGICGEGGLCEEAECAASTDCAEGERCLGGRCLGQIAHHGDLCSGCEAMSSNAFRAVVTMGSVGIAGAPARTSRYTLQSATVQFVGP